MTPSLKTFNIIGAGNLGKAIAKLLVKNAQMQLLGVCNNSVASAETATYKNSLLSESLPTRAKAAQVTTKHKTKPIKQVRSDLRPKPSVVSSIAP